MRGGKVGALISPFFSSGFDGDERGCKVLEICVLRIIWFCEIWMRREGDSESMLGLDVTLYPVSITYSAGQHQLSFL